MIPHRSTSQISEAYILDSQRDDLYIRKFYLNIIKVPFQKKETFVVDWSIMSNSIASHKQLIPNIMASTMESTR